MSASLTDEELRRLDLWAVGRASIVPTMITRIVEELRAARTTIEQLTRERNLPPLAETVMATPVAPVVPIRPAPDPFVPRLLELMQAQREPSEADVERVARYIMGIALVNIVVGDCPGIDEFKDVARVALGAGLDPRRVP